MNTCPVIFLNGPPRCGKDTLAGHIVRAMPGFRLCKFAKVLKERTHALYGKPDLPHDAFEEVKDIPNEIFLGLSPREAYINVSERLMKPLHGNDVWGKILLNGMLEQYSPALGYVISDSGFEEEALPIIDRFGAENCLLIRIAAPKRGCTFMGDSRSYIELPVRTLNFYNNETVEEFLREADEQLLSWFQPLVERV